jgi:hypothetical protein
VSYRLELTDDVRNGVSQFPDFWDDRGGCVRNADDGCRVVQPAHCRIISNLGVFKLKGALCW